MAPGSRRNFDAARSPLQDVEEHSMTSLPQSKSKQARGPPPSLFLHPSPAASHVSLPGILASGAAASGPTGLTRGRSELGGDRLRPGDAYNSDTNRQGRNLPRQESTRSTDHTDALWAEMQATLEDVELSASSGTHVFGPEHDTKLAELRSAQIALAQAWARSEADEAVETSVRDKTTSSGGDEMRARTAKAAEGAKTGAPLDATGAAKSATVSTNGSGGAEGEKFGARLEEDTEVDIVLARKRRDANDNYFQRVNNGVLDVVAKLEEVAFAMRAVEQESKDAWDENKSAPESVGG